MHTVPTTPLDTLLTYNWLMHRHPNRMSLHCWTHVLTTGSCTGILIVSPIHCAYHNVGITYHILVPRPRTIPLPLTCADISTILICSSWGKWIQLFIPDRVSHRQRRRPTLPFGQSSNRPCSYRAMSGRSRPTHWHYSPTTTCSRFLTTPSRSRLGASAHPPARPRPLA